jgi:lactoylglutathione lyase
MSVDLTHNYDDRSYAIGDAWGLTCTCTQVTYTTTGGTLLGRHAEDYRDPESCGDRYPFTKDCDGHGVEIVER